MGILMPLQITHLDHVSVLVTNLDRSRRFYGDLLGLREIPKPRTFTFSVLWFDLGGEQLHLLLAPQADAVSPRHFALRVADIEAARHHFHERGIAIKETVVIPGADRFFVTDPDGNRIEIIQWLAPYDPTANE
jgi:glyoxylase I family protein